MKTANELNQIIKFPNFILDRWNYTEVKDVHLGELIEFKQVMKSIAENDIIVSLSEEYQAVQLSIISQHNQKLWTLLILAASAFTSTIVIPKWVLNFGSPFWMISIIFGVSVGVGFISQMQKRRVCGAELDDLATLVKSEGTNISESGEGFLTYAFTKQIPVYRMAGPIHLLKFPLNIWADRKFMIFLMGSNSARKAIQSNKTLPIEDVYFLRADVLKYMNTQSIKQNRLSPNTLSVTYTGSLESKKKLPAKQPVPEMSRGPLTYEKATRNSPYFRALIESGYIEIYAKCRESWFELESHPDFKGKLKVRQVRYDLLIMYIHGNFTKFKAVYRNPNAPTEDLRQIDKEIRTAIEIPLNPTSKMPQQILKGEYSACSKFLKTLEFIDEKSLPTSPRSET